MYQTKVFCDECGREDEKTRHITVDIPTLVVDRPNKPWPGNNVFSIDVCCQCFNSVCDKVLEKFGKSSKDIK